MKEKSVIKNKKASNSFSRRAKNTVLFWLTAATNIERREEIRELVVSDERRLLLMFVGKFRFLQGWWCRHTTRDWDRNLRGASYVECQRKCEESCKGDVVIREAFSGCSNKLYFKKRRGKSNLALVRK